MSKTSEDEIRKVFQEWFEDSAAKNLDAVMTKIAHDVVSYEHRTPLKYEGEPAVRQVCAQGFEAAKGVFRWDIPDLRIVVRGDIAITWGLDHLQAREPGTEGWQYWSRGTRVFQKVEGKWRMIHQHLSFPLDPATGRAAMDLSP